MKTSILILKLIFSAKSYVNQDRDNWARLDMEAPKNPAGRSRKSKFKNLLPGDHDPNDSRYTGTIKGDYIKDPNDSRYCKTFELRKKKNLIFKHNISKNNSSDTTLMTPDIKMLTTPDPQNPQTSDGKFEMTVRNRLFLYKNLSLPKILNKIIPTIQFNRVLLRMKKGIFVQLRVSGKKLVLTKTS